MMRLKFSVLISSTLEPISSESMIKLVPETHGSSSLGNAAHMAAFMSKKGLMERGIHRATVRKASTASDDLDIISPGTRQSTATYLSVSSSCVSILVRMNVTISVRAAGGMVVVRIKEGISR
jgi:hypothetical protein